MALRSRATSSWSTTSSPSESTGSVTSWLAGPTSRCARPTPPSAVRTGISTDAAPRFDGHGGVGKPGDRPTGGPASDRDAKKGAVGHEVEVFAKTIGEYLEKARTSHRYDRPHLVAPPKFLGQLRKELGKEVQKLVAEELPKDLSWLRRQDLEEKLLGR